MRKPNCFRFALRPLAVLALAALTFSSMSVARAQSSGDDWKTLAVFSMTSTDEGAPLIKQLLAATGHEGLLDDFEQQQREAFETLDFSKPKGIVCQTDGRTFRVLGFAAMSDMTALPYDIGETIADTKADRDGWHKIPLPNSRNMPVMFQNVYAKQAGDWAWFCYGSLRPPKTLPDDPTELLEGLPAEYPVALRLNFEAAPRGMVNTYAMMGKQLIPMIKLFLPMAHAGEEQQEIMMAYFDFLEVVLKESIDQLVKFVNEAETMTIGLYGNDDNDVFVTYRVVAKPGTDTGEAFQMARGATTDLLGFFRPDESVISYVYAMRIPDYQKDYIKRTYVGMVDFFNVLVTFMRQQMEEYGPDEAPEAFDKIEVILAKLPDIIEKTIDAGKFDFVVNGSGFSNLYAFKLVGGNKLREPINELFDFAQLMILQEMGDTYDDEDIASAPMLKRETYKGIQLWSVSVPLPMRFDEEDFEDEEEDEPRGSYLSYVIGLNDEVFIYAQGTFTKQNEVLDAVKAGIDASTEPQPLPEEWMVFSPRNFAQTIKRLFDQFPFRDEDVLEDFDEKWNIPKDANIVVTQEIEDNAFTQTIIVSGKIWPVVGKLIEMALENANLPFSIGN